MSRELVFRQQENPNLENLKEPFLYLNEYNLYPKIMIGEKYYDCKDFPNCVTHYYWIHKGKNDEDSWRTLFKYKDEEGNNMYGFYVAECDYTGFDCQGQMEIYTSDKYEVLIDKAFDDWDYILYMKETSIL
jgi:hypothetical protein